jgi:Zn-dependent peptidase ImmA (M78 family)
VSVATRSELGHRGALCAREVVKSLKLRAVDEINIEEIAALHDLFIIDGGLRGAQGRLVRRENRGRIRIQTNLVEPARRRYIIAHELGHHLLHADRVALCAERDLVRYEPGNAETEANAFAAELLMPRALFEPHCDVRLPSLDGVRKLARHFGTTLTATAIRFVDLCPEACAIVWSEAMAIRWAIAGPDFPFIRFAMQLNSHSHAFDAFRGKMLPTGPQEVPAHAWIDDARYAEVVEDSFWMPRFSAVLSLLWVRGAD